MVPLAMDEVPSLRRDDLRERRSEVQVVSLRPGPDSDDVDPVDFLIGGESSVPVGRQDRDGVALRGKPARDLVRMNLRPSRVRKEARGDVEQTAPRCDEAMVPGFGGRQPLALMVLVRAAVDTGAPFRDPERHAESIHVSSRESSYPSVNRRARFPKSKVSRSSCDKPRPAHEAMGSLRELENLVSEVEIVVLVDRPGGVAAFPSRAEDVISEC